MPWHFSRRRPEWMPLGSVVSASAPSRLSRSFSCLSSISGPGQFGPGLFLVEDRTVLIPDAPEGVERPGMDHFAQDAGVEQAEVVDGRDAAR